MLNSYFRKFTASRRNIFNIVKTRIRCLIFVCPIIRNPQKIQNISSLTFSISWYKLEFQVLELVLVLLIVSGSLCSGQLRFTLFGLWLHSDFRIPVKVYIPFSMCNRVSSRMPIQNNGIVASHCKRNVLKAKRWQL